MNLPALLAPADTAVVTLADESSAKVGYAIFSDAVSIIEWANYIEEILPKDFLHIYIEKDLEKGEDYRKITITPYGERYDYIKELKI